MRLTDKYLQLKLLKEGYEAHTCTGRSDCGGCSALHDELEALWQEVEDTKQTEVWGLSGADEDGALKAINHEANEFIREVKKFDRSLFK